MPTRYLSKQEIKEILEKAPEGTSHQKIINDLFNKGYVLEGYVPKGDKGDKGDKGEKGDRGPAGPQGLPGEDGLDGRDGRDGRDGKDGKDGRDGKDAVLPDLKELAVNTVNYIETLEGDDRIDAKSIKNLPTATQTIIERGGGFVETSIKAGSNVTVTKDAFGTWIIASSASGSGGLSKLTATGTVNGTNTDFTFASEPSIIVADQRMMQKVSSDGTVNWTGTTDVSLTIAPTFDIFGL